MVTFLLSIILILIIAVNSQQSICIWGSLATNTFLNGEYVYQGVTNGAPWYRLDIDPSWQTNTIYLWRYESQYYFTDHPPAGTVSQYAGKCNIPTSNPTECASNWYIGSSVDSDVSAQIAPCPSWDCDAIITKQTDQGCDGPFDVKVAENAWRNTANTVYWYFSPSYFMWGCSDTYSLKSNQPFYAYTNDKWKDVIKGGFVRLDFERPTAARYRVDCIKNPTIAPTIEPSQSPTNNPSKIPSISPSHHPSEIPTTFPSKIPSATPSETPFNAPVVLGQQHYYNFTIGIFKNNTNITNDAILNVIRNSTNKYDVNEYHLEVKIVSSDENTLIVSIIVIAKDKIKINEFEQRLLAKTEIELTAQFGDQINMMNAEMSIADDMQTTKMHDDVKSNEEEDDENTSLYLIIPTIILLLVIVGIIIIVYTHKYRKESEKRSDTKRVTSISHTEINKVKETQFVNVNTNDTNEREGESNTDSEIYDNYGHDVNDMNDKNGTDSEIYVNHEAVTNIATPSNMDNDLNLPFDDDNDNEDDELYQGDNEYIKDTADGTTYGGHTTGK